MVIVDQLEAIIEVKVVGHLIEVGKSIAEETIHWMLAIRKHVLVLGLSYSGISAG